MLQHVSLKGLLQPTIHKARWPDRLSWPCCLHGVLPTVCTLLRTESHTALDPKEGAGMPTSQPTRLLLAPRRSARRSSVYDYADAWIVPVFVRCTTESLVFRSQPDRYLQHLQLRKVCAMEYPKPSSELSAPGQQHAVTRHLGPTSGQELTVRTVDPRDLQPGGGTTKSIFR